ncbi:PQ-loop repeat-containing protein [Cysteiniphilum halobium]|uniref:PQ-loop repeat-containing protein n=1 Tax=Cysteiniphilum halobium TaxID=2219059 RepID=UPI003F835276
MLSYLGEFTLNLSLALYFIHFLPQLYHNIYKPNYNNISLNTQIMYLGATSLDLIYGLGFNYQWQYIAVDIVYLSTLSIQQFQLMYARIFSIFIHILSFLWIIFIVITAVVLVRLGHKSQGFHIGSNDNLIFWISGYISSFLWIILWFPQIIKNFFYKTSGGYSLPFIVIGVIITLSDITSALIYHWKWLNLLTSIINFLSYFCLFIQSCSLKKQQLYSKI